MLKLKKRAVSVRVGDIMASADMIRRMLEIAMPTSSAFAFASNVDVIQPIIDRVMKQRSQILQRYEIAQTEPVDEEEIKANNAKIEQAQVEWTEVVDSEIEIEVYPVSLDMKAEIPPTLVMGLWFLFEETLEAKAPSAEIPAAPPQEG